VEFDAGLAWESLRITRIHLLEAQQPKSRDYWSLPRSQHTLTIGKYIMEVFRPFWYCTPGMSKWHTAAMHGVIVAQNFMSHRINGVMQALPKKQTRCNEELYVAVKFAHQKLF
jgi:hypothetical protein